MPASIQIAIIIPPFEEGWTGTPDDMILHIVENATFEATGAFLTGQIGGARPTENVGLWVNGTSIEVWSEELSKYVPLNVEPIGSVKAYTGNAAPENYLLCQGQLVIKNDYLELFAVVGEIYNKSGDPSDQFRVPDLQGRYIAGAGLGDYNPKGTATINGKLKELTNGDYLGLEWINRVEKAGVNTPSGSSNRFRLGTAYNGYGGANFSSPRPATIVLNYIIRAK